MFHWLYISTETNESNNKKEVDVIQFLSKIHTLICKVLNCIIQYKESTKNIIPDSHPHEYQHSQQKNSQALTLASALCMMAPNVQAAFLLPVVGSMTSKVGPQARQASCPPPTKPPNTLCGEEDVSSSFVWSSWLSCNSCVRGGRGVWRTPFATCTTLTPTISTCWGDRYD